MDAASRLVELPIRRDAIRRTAGDASAAFQLAAAVAAYGQLLRGGTYTGQFGYDDVVELAQPARDLDPETRNFLELVKLADSLSTHPSS
jgi:Ca-activated chloride channel family protein